jgi:hypothetical protein
VTSFSPCSLVSSFQRPNALLGSFGGKSAMSVGTMKARTVLALPLYRQGDGGQGGLKLRVQRAN